MGMDGWYWIGWKVSFVLVFIGGWIYCFRFFGFRWGFGLGWLSSLIAAVILSFLWPLFWPFLILFVLGGPEWDD